MKRWVWTGAAMVLALGVAADNNARLETPQKWKEGWDTITVEDASKLVHHLAGPAFSGRHAATQDFNKAALWCADWMKANGIKPGAPNGTYFQPFHIESRRPDADSATVFVGGQQTDLKFGRDYAFQAEDDFDVVTKIAFVRLPKGQSLYDLDWKALHGRLVIVHPDTVSDPESGFTRLAGPRAPANPGFTIVGASASGTLTAAPITRIRELKGGEVNIRGYRFTLDGARALARAVEADGFAAQHNDRPGVEVGEVRFRGKVAVEPWISTINVIGKIPGTDPQLSKEAVVVGAHLDHMGVRQGATYWGADDNASGVGAALMIGRAAAKNPVKPKRSILIGLWSAEELGLHGSKMYAGNPTISMEDTVAYLNMDMVGRDADYAPFGDRPEDNRNAIYIGSAEFSSPELHGLLVAANRYIGLNLRDDKNDRTRRSDTGSFYDKNVPVLKAFTGEHKDYHKPTDTPDKVNYPKMTNVARWLYLSASELASSSWRPAFDANARILSGKAEIASRASFSSDAVFYATLIESNVDGSSSTVIDRTSQVQPGQAPFSFGLKYHPTRIDPNKLYVIRASVYDKGQLKYRTKAGLRVMTYNHPAENVVVKMEPR